MNLPGQLVACDCFGEEWEDIKWETNPCAAVVAGENVCDGRPMDLHCRTTGSPGGCVSGVVPLVLEERLRKRDLARSLINSPSNWQTMPGASLPRRGLWSGRPGLRGFPDARPRVLRAREP
jgi:hypothetical protein